MEESVRIKKKLFICYKKYKEIAVQSWIYKILPFIAFNNQNISRSLKLQLVMFYSRLPGDPGFERCHSKAGSLNRRL